MKRDDFCIYSVDTSTNLYLPYFQYGLKAGFPSPALDYKANPIDLNMALSLYRGCTGIIKITDNDLEGVNIFMDDYALIDTDITPANGNKISCRIDNEIINRIYIYDYQKKSILLRSTDSRIPDINLSNKTDFEIYGVITFTITRHVPGRFYPNGKNSFDVDLNKLLIKNPTYTFYGKVEGDSMRDAHILNSDLSIIDKSLPYENGYKALCMLKDKFTIKYLLWDNEQLFLKPANTEFPLIKVSPQDGIKVWGIITYTITPHLK